MTLSVSRCDPIDACEAERPALRWRDTGMRRERLSAGYFWSVIGYRLTAVWFPAVPLRLQSRFSRKPSPANWSRYKEQVSLSTKITQSLERTGYLGRPLCSAVVPLNLKCAERFEKAKGFESHETVFKCCQNSAHSAYTVEFCTEFCCSAMLFCGHSFWVNSRLLFIRVRPLVN